VLAKQAKSILSMSHLHLAHLSIQEAVYRAIEAYKMSREAFYSSMSFD
jgi:hypothetical protein